MSGAGASSTYGDTAYGSGSGYNSYQQVRADCGSDTSRLGRMGMAGQPPHQTARLSPWCSRDLSHMVAHVKCSQLVCGGPAEYDRSRADIPNTGPLLSASCWIKLACPPAVCNSQARLEADA